MKPNSNRNPIRTKARKMRSKITQIATQAEHTTESVMHRTMSRVGTLGTTGAKYLREHPWQAALAAIALGFIAGIRARRSRWDFSK